MNVDPFIILAGVVLLVLLLVMSAAFFVLNSNLEDQNKRLKDQVRKLSEGKP